MYLAPVLLLLLLLAVVLLLAGDTKIFEPMTGVTRVLGALNHCSSWDSSLRCSGARSSG
jgi:hypothetical protein